MNGRRTIVAGTDFAVLYTAIRDDVELPDVLPDEIPAEWLDDLSGYDLKMQLSTTCRGTRILASTEPGPGMLGIRRLDAAHLAVNVPHTATEGMDEGEIVLTIELLHRATGAIIKAEKRTIPIVKVRNFNPE